MKKIFLALLLFAPSAWSTTVGYGINRSGGDWTNWLQGFNNPDTTSITYIVGKSGSAIYAGSLTFSGVAIPQGSTIDTAYLTSVSRFATTALNDSIETQMWAYDSDTGIYVNDSTTWRTCYTNRTTANTIEAGPASTTANGRFTSYDTLTAIIQEIVNRAGWSSGNSITLIFQSTANTDAGKQIALSNWDRSTTNRDSIVIQYTAAAGGGGGATPNTVIRSATVRTTTLRSPERMFYRPKENWKW